jgi:hypothetical protein
VETAFGNQADAAITYMWITWSIKFFFFLINNNFIEETKYTRRVQGERIQIAQSAQRTEIYKFNEIRESN